MLADYMLIIWLDIKRINIKYNYLYFSLNPISIVIVMNYKVICKKRLMRSSSLFNYTIII